MKKTLTGLLLIFSFYTTFAQNDSCSCSSELDYVATQLKSTPSYKSQIKNTTRHDAYLAGIQDKINQDPDIDRNCLAYLQQYLKVLKDEHNYIVDRSENTDYTALTPFYDKSMEAIYAQNELHNDAITGTYKLLDFYTVVVTKSEADSKVYTAVVVESKNEQWQPGQIKFTLTKTGDYFHGIFYDGNHSPRYQKIEFRAGRLYPERWIHDDFKANWQVNNYQIQGDTFEYKKLTDKTHYIRLGDFDGDNTTYGQAMDLLEQLKQNYSSGNLIIDLRNNGGGGRRTSDPFVKYLKKIKKDIQIYIVQNRNVGSNSEQFILKLKSQIGAITTFGENTRGALAYGFGNYAKPSLITPCFGYSLGLTTTKYERFLKYEGVGLAPDFYLDSKTAWIDQVLAKIEQ